MIQLSETGEQLLHSLMFEVIGFSPYLCVPSPFSSFDNNSINSGLRFICKPWSLSCLPTVLSCSPLYSPFYHLPLQPSIIVSPSFSVTDFQNPDILFLSSSFLQSFCVPESEISCYCYTGETTTFAIFPCDAFFQQHMPMPFLRTTLRNSLKVFPKYFHLPY